MTDKNLAKALLNLGVSETSTGEIGERTERIIARDRRWVKLLTALTALLWLATLAVLALAFFPSYGAKLVRTPPVDAATAESAQLETVKLRIGGMTCEACAGVVKYTLYETPGVAEAEVDYPSGWATVKYDPTQTDTAKLVEAVNATGYTAEISGPSARN